MRLKHCAPNRHTHQPVIRSPQHHVIAVCDTDMDDDDFNEQMVLKKNIDVQLAPALRGFCKCVKCFDHQLCTQQRGYWCMLKHKQF